MSRNTELNEMRKQMGTLPNEELEIKTAFHMGVEGISVEMMEHVENPYKLIFESAVATWGNEEYSTKWPDTSPKNRFTVVNASLSGQTLPIALESVSFGFIVRGASRSAFDQHARMRIGTTFFSQGVRDNSRADAGFRIPTEFQDDPELLEEVKCHIDRTKKLYVKIVKRGHGSFQSARSILPMGITHQYKFRSNLQALKGYMGTRLAACEQSDTCAVAIATWDQINQKFPLIGSNLKPTCDYARTCIYHKMYTLSELFGCLFAGCGRWPDENPYSTFNRSCSSYETLQKELGIYFPSPADWPVFKTYEDLSKSDKKLFED